MDQQPPDSPTLRKRANASEPTENPPPYENLYPDVKGTMLPSEDPEEKSGTSSKHVVAVAVPLAHPLIHFGPETQRTVCPHCRAEIATDVRPTPTTKTHLVALLLFCFICWPCACLPYCMDSCQNLNHYCPHCDAYLGTYES